MNERQRQNGRKSINASTDDFQISLDRYLSGIDDRATDDLGVKVEPDVNESSGDRDAILETPDFAALFDSELEKNKQANKAQKSARQRAGAAFAMDIEPSVIGKNPGSLSQDNMTDQSEMEDRLSKSFADELALQMGEIQQQNSEEEFQQEDELLAFVEETLKDSNASMDMVDNTLDKREGYPDGNRPDLILSDQDDTGKSEGPKKRISGSSRIGRMMLILAVLIGTGAIGYNFLGSTDNSEPPVLIKADKEPFKVRPEEPGGKKIANQNQPVYDAITGSRADNNSQERLIVENESPIESTAMNVEGAGVSEENSSDGELAAMQPRRVKTVSVRADGSIITPVVQQQDSLSDINSSGVMADDKTYIRESVIPEVNSIQKVNEIEDTPIKAVESSDSSVSQDPVIAAPVPIMRKPKPDRLPVDRTDSVQNQVLSPQPDGKEYAVQISSQRSLEDARASYENLRRQFSGLLSGRPKEIYEARVNGRGSFYRVRIPVGEKVAAIRFCESYKAAGGNCFVTR